MARILLVGVEAAKRLAPFLAFLWTPLERFCVRAATTTTTTPPGFFACYRDAFERVNAAERLAAQANGAAFEALPAFGGSGTAWPQVHRFYAAARSFRSCRADMPLLRAGGMTRGRALRVAQVVASPQSRPSPCPPPRAWTAGGGVQRFGISQLRLRELSSA